MHDPTFHDIRATGRLNIFPHIFADFSINLRFIPVVILLSANHAYCKVLLINNTNKQT
jgi:hypothetical protein